MEVTSHAELGDKWLFWALKRAQGNFGLGSAALHPPQSEEVLPIRLVGRIVHTGMTFLGNFRSQYLSTLCID